MKNIVYLLIILTPLMVSCGGDHGKIPADVVKNPVSARGDNADGLPIISFEKLEHDFGKLIEGETVTYNFKFKNTGKADLLISQVHSSCGCTVPDYPTNTIKPGESGFIKVTFDSAGRTGIQNKAVTIVSNCQPNQTILKIKGQVIKP